MDELFTQMIFEPGMHVFRALEPARVLFETVEGGGDGGGGEGGGDPAAGAGAAVADPALGGDLGADGAGAGAGGDVEYLTTDDIASLVRENAGTAFAELLQQAEARDQAAARARADAQARAAANEPPPWDPFDPAAMERHFEWRDKQTEQRLMEQVAPALEFAQNGSLEAGKSEANTILDGYHKELGEFDHDPAILKAAAYMRQGLEPEQALQQAASEQAAYEARIESRAREKLLTAGQNLADAGIEPGASGAAADVVQQPLTRAGQRIDYKDVARGTLARMGRGNGVNEGE